MPSKAGRQGTRRRRRGIRPHKVTHPGICNLYFISSIGEIESLWFVFP